MIPSHTILIVDDEMTALAICQSILDGVGDYKIFVADSGEKAVKIFRDSPVDLLITDINMPGMSGIELIAEVRKVTDDFLAMVLTGAEDIETAINAMNVGTFGYMRKPVSPEELKAQVVRALQHLDLSRELARQKESNLRHALLAHGGRMAALGEMASAMAHEINQPLNVMSIITQGWELLAAKGLLEMDKVLADISKVRSNINRISTLIDHVRCLGSQNRVVEEISPAEVINRAMDLCMVQLKKHAIELKVNIEPDTPKILGVVNELEQVIINLIANARYAIQNLKKHDDNFRGEINVMVSCHDSIEIIVQDNGGGMPEPVARRLFEPFYSTKPVGEGTGLGLSISKDIVEKNNGTIRLDNQSGVGARFVITFPVL